MVVALVCPDKFKGTLTAPEAGRAMADGLRAAGFDDIRVLPLADGGDGTLDALLAARGGSRRHTTVTGPLGEDVDAEWGLLHGGTAVIEMARASGLGLVEGRNDALRASTRGTGELIAAALRAGARRVVVGVGGSATTDGGLAAVEALGWSLGGADVTVAYDVGDAVRRRGASSARRRARPTRRWPCSRAGSPVLPTSTRRAPASTCALPGAGAAGGLAGGLAAIGARLEPGFDVVASAAGLEDALDDVALVVTGEGRLDPSSFDGKVVGGVLEWATDAGVPRIAVIVGQATPEAREEIAVFAGAELLVLTDRVWQSGEAFSRSALLVEEAATEAGRRALASP